MKIVAIMGSPKGKGSGYAIVKKLESAMKALGDVEFAYLFLKHANLKPCIGCYDCMAAGEGRCPLQDDRPAIEQQLLAADGIILSSPVYVSNVSWLMKTFIDRFAYLNHRPRLHRQKLLTVVNMAGTERKGAQSALRIAIGFARGARNVHELAIATPPWPQTKRAVARKEQAIETAARRFYRTCLEASLPSPTLRSYLDFLIMQKLSLACRKYLPADYAFYQGKTYYYAATVNPILAATAKAIAGAMMKAYLMMGMGPGDVAWPA